MMTEEAYILEIDELKKEIYLLRKEVTDLNAECLRLQEVVNNTLQKEHQNMEENSIDFSDLPDDKDSLKSENEMLKAIIENMGVGVGITDSSGNTLSLNKAALKIHGFQSEEEMFSPFIKYTEEFELKYPDGGTMPVEEWPTSRALRGEFVQDYEVKLTRRKRNIMRHIKYNVVPVYNDFCELMLIVFNMTDVTDIKLLNEALLNSEKRYSYNFNKLGFETIGLDINEVKQVENALDYERQLFEGIFNNIPVLITIYEPSLKNFRFNKEMKQVLGWTEEDAADGDFLEKVYPDPDYRAEVIAYMKSLSPGWREYTTTAKDGTKVISSWANILLTTGVQIGIGIDIRERKKAESKFHENEKRLQGIFNNAAIGIVETDSEDRFVNVNDRICEILGYNRNELIGKTVSEITAPEDRVRSDEMNERLHQGNFPLFHYEKRYLRKDGSALWVHVSVSSIRDSKGKHLKSIGTIEDISERKRVELNLQESEEKFRSLFENVTEGVALHEIIYENDVAVNYRITNVNPAYERNCGIDIATAEGSLATNLYGVQEPPYFDIFMKVAETREPYSFETFFPSMNKYFIINVVSPKKGQFATVFEDISEQKRNEQQIKQKNEELTRFIYAVSHDLKSPLLTIKSFTSFLKSDIENENKEALDVDISYIMNAADKMGRLLDELLELSRIGRKEPPKVEVPLREIAQNAIDLVAGRINKGNVKIEFVGPPVMLFGHSQRLIQIFLNLIDNSVKFMDNQPNPVIEIGSTIERNNVLLFVRDNGSGIDPRYHHKVFGLFEKLDNNKEGTGIGLALVKRIVEVHGGSIWFTSEGAGEGTTFYFTLERTHVIKNP